MLLNLYLVDLEYQIEGIRRNLESSMLSNMPSILVETAFISNYSDAILLANNE